jgi:hypothetical protein
MGLAVRIIGHNVYIEKAPEKKHTRYIQKAEEAFYIVDSCVLKLDKSIDTDHKKVLSGNVGLCRRPSVSSDGQWHAGYGEAIDLPLVAKPTF